MILAVALAACAGGERSPDSGDGLSGRDVPLDWRLDPAWEVGGVEAPEWAAFGEVTGLAFGPDGSLYVLDGRSGTVVAADTSGAFLRRVGSPGEGPGELRYPAALAVHDSGAVTVWDAGHGAFVVFGPDGVFLRNVPLDRDSFPAPEGPLAITAGGALVSPTTIPRAGTEEGATPGRPLVAYSDGPDGEHRVLFRTWDPPLPATTEPGPDVTGGFRVRLPPVIAFHPPLLVTPLRDGGLAFADTVTWRLTLVDAAGGSPRRLERPLAPRRVTEEIREEERGRRLAAALEDLPRMVLSRPGGGSAAVPPDAVRRLEEARIAGMGFHPEVPVISGLLTDGEGRIWVVRSSGAAGGAGPVDVLEPDGSYLGTLPAGFLPEDAVLGPDGWLAAPGLDELGTPVVRVFRLRPGGGTGE